MIFAIKEWQYMFFSAWYIEVLDKSSTFTKVSRNNQIKIKRATEKFNNNNKKVYWAFFP